MRREWHKAGARERWAADREAKWVEWKRRRYGEGSPDGSHRPDRSGATQSKVWVKGHVPNEFLDWVERSWSHGDEGPASSASRGRRPARVLCLPHLVNELLGVRPSQANGSAVTSDTVVVYVPEGAFLSLKATVPSAPVAPVRVA